MASESRRASWWAAGSAGRVRTRVRCCAPPFSSRWPWRAIAVGSLLLVAGCSLLGWSDDIAVASCDVDADCAELGVLADAAACFAGSRFVCGDEGFCERANTAEDLDAAVGPSCMVDGAIDAGVTDD